jgi:glycosyltransferase involved in cell wall biosynthesis
VRGCDHLCVTSREYRDDFLRRYPGLPAAKVSFIPNGFDPADFEGLEPERFGRFTLLHAGNFYGARSAGFFLTAYGRVLDRRPDLRERTQVAFVGSLDKAATDMLGGSSMRENVLLLGQRPHRATLGLTCGADALLLIPGPGNGTMPGKTYEYLRAGRPIYCLASEGPAAALIRETGAGLVEPSEAPGAIADSLERFLDQVQTGGGFVCPPETLRQFDRREIAGLVAVTLSPHSSS